MASYIGTDTRSIQRGIVNHIEYTLACTRFNFRTPECYQATAHSIKDRLIESFNDTNQHQFEEFPKRVCYLSLEYLLGRLMQNALINLDMEEEYRTSLLDIGHRLEDLYEEEVDPALGNGGKCHNHPQAWVVWLLASWTLWRPSTSQHGGMVFAITTVSSSRSS